MVLARFAEDVYVEARGGRFLGVETGTRMTVVRLSGGGLFVHSPVALDRATREAVDALGEVRAVVAPSIFHHLYAGEWARAFPRAVLAACPGLEHKRPDLPFTCVMGDVPHEVWARDLAQVCFSSRRENEVVFFHPRSRTMICSDALLNLSTHGSRATRLVARVMGNRAPGMGWPERLMIRDRRVARRQVDRILEWDVERIVLAHGELVEQGGREIVRRAYAWL